MIPFPGPEAQLDEVRNLWSTTARDTLEKRLNIFDDLFMKYKADFGESKIAKQPIENKPGTITHRESVHRMSPEKAERANQEVHDRLALGMIQPSLSPRAIGVAMGKKTNDELRFCCDFRHLNEVIIKAFRDWAKPNSTQALTSRTDFGKYQCKPDRHKTAFACEFGLLEWRRMPFGMCNDSATFQCEIARALQNRFNRQGSMVMAYIDDIVVATETTWNNCARFFNVCVKPLSRCSCPKVIS